MTFALSFMTVYAGAGELSTDRQREVTPIGGGDLLTPIKSFGAAVQGQHLYVLGGHIGENHQHSQSNLSGKFARRLLDNPNAPWEILPGEFPLQSVSLVSDGNYLYRIGGVNSLNKAEEKEDMRSVDEVAVYDPTANSWKNLPSLPEPRSSHDSVIIGSDLIVVGGWRLNGSSKDGEWLSTVYRLNLQNPTAWVKLSEAPFKRRALAAAGYAGKLFVIGGIDDQRNVSNNVDILELESGTWRVGPSVPISDKPGSDMSAFGCSAFAVRQDLYVSGAEGTILKLSCESTAWEPIGHWNQRRFFHRLISNGTRLIVAGGVNRDGSLKSIELFPIK